MGAGISANCPAINSQKEIFVTGEKNYVAIYKVDEEKCTYKENVTNLYTAIQSMSFDDLDNLFAAADCLSSVDMFENDIEATNWDLMPHVAVNCISATSNCHNKAQTKFPSFLAKTSTKGKNKRIIQELSIKFGQYRISNLTFKLDYLKSKYYISIENNGDGVLSVKTTAWDLSDVTTVPVAIAPLTFSPAA